ncbi:hypothetical protein, partial [Candidatus Ichthyocystis sparus]|uniref:hypothetical protein n=1 Tax=Candidatus Ichthyocystis sparus TaxID=1561004 RepID=UPI00159EE920
SDGLSVIGRGIWYNTYSSMFRYFFVSRCLGEYHANHRPGFIRTLPDIQIISDSSDHSTVSLTGDVLLGFLSRLDCAILSGIESVFDSCFVEASVSLEEESLSTISCQDFVDVMSVAAIPEIALSVTLVSFAVTKSKKLRIPVDNVLVPAPTNAGKRTVRATIWTPPVVAGPSSGPIAAGGRMGSDNATVSTRARRTRADFSVQESPVSPISVEDDLPSSTVPIPFYVQCTDSLGFKLHPSSARLINDFFRDVNFAFVMSFLKSIRNYILTAMGSGLSIIERSVWLTTYRELYLHNFISRCLGIYHYNHRPAFIRNLANVRVLSDSSGLDLPLVGGDLVSFLSRLDKAVQDLISSIFDSRWCIEVDNACSGLEDISLYDVSCGDLICVLDTAGIPESALSVYQRRRERVARRNASRGSAVHIGETPGSSGGVTSEGKASRTDIASTGAASVSVQLSPKLSSRSEHGSLSRSRLQSEKQSGPLLLLEEAPDRSYRVFVRSLFCRYQSASLSATGTVSTSEVSGDVLVSTVDEGAAS